MFDIDLKNIYPYCTSQSLGDAMNATGQVSVLVLHDGGVAFVAKDELVDGCPVQGRFQSWIAYSHDHLSALLEEIAAEPAHIQVVNASQSKLPNSSDRDLRELPRARIFEVINDAIVEAAELNQVEQVAHSAVVLIPSDHGLDSMVVYNGEQNWLYVAFDRASLKSFLLQCGMSANDIFDINGYFELPDMSLENGLLFQGVIAGATIVHLYYNNAADAC